MKTETLMFEVWMKLYMEYLGSVEVLASGFRLLDLTGKVDGLPCGCDAACDEVIVLHYGNMLYCCGGKKATHPTQCHQVIYPRLSASTSTTKKTELQTRSFYIFEL